MVLFKKILFYLAITQGVLLFLKQPFTHPKGVFSSLSLSENLFNIAYIDNNRKIIITIFFIFFAVIIPIIADFKKNTPSEHREKFLSINKIATSNYFFIILMLISVAIWQIRTLLIHNNYNRLICQSLYALGFLLNAVLLIFPLQLIHRSFNFVKSICLKRVKEKFL